MSKTKFVVTVSWIGTGMYQGGTFSHVTNFVDERKAHDFYTDMLVKYPDAEVKLTQL